MEDNPDFSSYDYETLIDVFDHIDERQYPERKQQVADLLEARKFAPETVKQQAEGQHRQRYDTFFQRLFAYIIDSLLLWIPSTALAAFMLSSPGLVASALAIIGELIVLAYYIIFHWMTGQTIGKKILSVRVVNNENEQSISLRQAAIREILPLAVIGLVAIVSLFVPEMHSLEGVVAGEPTQFQRLAGGVLLLWALLELITMLFHNRHRALHDIIAGTVVVNELPSQK